MRGLTSLSKTLSSLAGPVFSTKAARNSWSPNQLQGLVKYYSLDNTSGDATWTGTATYVTGEINQAASFDGSTRYLSTPANLLATATQLTLAAWINASSLTSLNTIFEFGNSGQATAFWANINSSPSLPALMIYTSGQFPDVIATAFQPYGPGVNNSLATSTWYHLACTLDSSGNVLIWINGTVYGWGTLSPANTPATIGNTANNWIANGVEAKFAGSIDEVVVMNTAASLGSIQTLYTAGVAGSYSSKSPELGASLYFSFDNSKNVIAIYDTQDLARFRLISQYLIPRSNTSLRDPSPCQFGVGGPVYLSYTTGAFSQANSLDIATCNLYPYAWTQTATASFSDVNPVPVSGSRCWNGGLYYENIGGTTPTLFLCAGITVAGGTVDPLTGFVPYRKQTINPPGNWSSSAQITGSAIPGDCCPIFLMKANGKYYQTFDNHTTDAVTVSLCSSTSINSGYNTGRTITEAGTWIEGAIIYPNPSGGYYFYVSSFSVSGGLQIGLYRYTFNNIDNLIAGTETLQNQTLCTQTSSFVLFNGAMMSSTLQ